MDEVRTDVGIAAVKLTPPVVGFAMTLDQVVGLATLAYLVLQSAYLIWKWRNERRGKVSL